MDYQDYLFFIAFIIVLLGFIWSYRFSTWYSLSKRFTYNEEIKSENEIKYVDVGIREGDSWKGSINIKIKSDGKGVLFFTDGLLRYLFIPVYITWDDVLYVEESRRGFLNQKCIEVKLNDMEVSIIIGVTGHNLVDNWESKKNRVRLD